MLQVAVITLFPQIVNGIMKYGVTGRAVRNGLLKISSFDLRDYALNKHRTVDGRPYGGGPGMVMSVQPIGDAVKAARRLLDRAKVIYLSPQGRRLDQDSVNRISDNDQLIMVCGRYEGIDERIIESEIDEEWSIGDYVVSGGELPALVLIDAIARTIPGVLGHEDSAGEDSFANGLLDYPHYTRPEEFNGMCVPKVLVNGDHMQISRWRMKQALGRTWQRRPDLLGKVELNDEQRTLLNEIKLGKS